MYSNLSHLSAGNSVETEMSESRSVLFNVYPVPNQYPSAKKQYETAAKRKRERKDPAFDMPLRKYSCHLMKNETEACTWSFPSPAKLKRHLKTHKDAGVYVCQLCKTPITHNYNMYNHWRNNCRELKEYLDFKGKTQYSPEELKNLASQLMENNNSSVALGNPAGMVYIPNENYVEEISDESEMIHTETCPVCSLSVPVGMYKAHSLAHRGMLLVDGEFAKKYMCHLCGCTFKDVKKLRWHWRKLCPEVQAHLTGNINDRELAGLVFLLLQQSVPISVIDQLSCEDSRTLRSLRDEQLRVRSEPDEILFHCPREVAPLDLANILNEEDHEPIGDTMDPKIIRVLRTGDPTCELTIQERINLFAVLCPSFFSTRKEWFIIRNAETQKVERRVLRYKKEDTFVNQHEISTNSIPVPKDPLSKWASGKDRKCERCDLYFSSQGKLELHNNFYHLTQKGICVLCKTGNATVKKLINHWKLPFSCHKMWRMSPNYKHFSASHLRQLAFYGIQSELYNHEENSYDIELEEDYTGEIVDC